MILSDHAQICAPLRPSQNLDGQRSYTHVTAPTPNRQIFTAFVVFFLNTQLTVTCGCQGTAERHAPVAAEEGCGNTWCCLKVAEDCWPRLRLYGKITVPWAMLEWEVCEVFTCQTCKYHETKMWGLTAWLTCIHYNLLPKPGPCFWLRSGTMLLLLHTWYGCSVPEVFLVLLHLLAYGTTGCSVEQWNG